MSTSAFSAGFTLFQVLSLSAKTGASSLSEASFENATVFRLDRTSTDTGRYCRVDNTISGVFVFWACPRRQEGLGKLKRCVVALYVRLRRSSSQGRIDFDYGGDKDDVKLRTGTAWVY